MNIKSFKEGAVSAGLRYKILTLFEVHSGRTISNFEELNLRKPDAKFACCKFGVPKGI
jgi:hypothetical protein